MTDLKPIEANQVRPKISVVIPVYNSATTLVELHERLTKSLKTIVEDDYEILYVNDVSPDNAWSVLQEIKGDEEKVVLIRLMRNSGQQRAILCGIAHSKGDCVITMDDDLQQRPEDIHLLYEELVGTDSDVIIGSYPKKKHGVVRRIGTRAVRSVARVTVGAPNDLELTSFRAITRTVAESVVCLRNPSPVVGFLLLEVTSNIRNVEVHHDPRKQGKSTYSPKRLIEYFAQMVLDYSDLPLRLVGYLGLIVATISFGLGAYYLTRALGGGVGVEGWATIVLLICFFSGLILMSLGIIGVYLMRVLRSINVVRSYDVRDILR